MARTELTIRDIGRAGYDVNDNAETVTAANGAQFRNSGREWIYIIQTTGGAVTLTVPIPRTTDGAATASKTWTLTDGHHYTLPPFPTDAYNNPNEKVYLNITGTVHVTIYRDGT